LNQGYFRSLARFLKARIGIIVMEVHGIWLIVALDRWRE
jgi:hypothetical protein